MTPLSEHPQLYIDQSRLAKHLTVRPELAIATEQDHLYADKFKTEDDLLMLGSENLKVIRNYHRSLVKKSRDDVGILSERIFFLLRLEPEDFTTIFEILEIFRLERNDIMPPQDQFGLSAFEELRNTDYLRLRNRSLAVGKRELCRRDLDEIARAQRIQQAIFMASARIYENQVRYLDRLIERAERKPLLPLYRPRNYFNAHERVYCVFHWPEFKASYRQIQKIEHRYGEADICFSDAYAKNFFMSISDPRLMKRWEYEYYRGHHEYIRFLQEVCKLNPDFDFVNDAFYGGWMNNTFRALLVL